jgi:two-component system chemotaxis sensor kinase CheA
MDLSRFYNQFREETAENVRVLSDAILTLEQADVSDPATRAQVDSVFRAMHTVKGSARMLGFATVSQLAHAMEDVLGAAREGRLMLARTLIDQLLQGGDIILTLSDDAVEGREPRVSEAQVADLIAALHAGLPSAAAEPAAPAPADEAAPAELTEAETSETGEPADTSEAPEPSAAAAVPAATSDPPAAPAAPEPQPQAAAAPRAAASKPPTRRSTVRVRTDRLDRLINLTGELVIGQQTLVLHNQAMRELMLLNQQQERTLQGLESELRHYNLPADQETHLYQEVNTLLNAYDRMRQLLRNEVERFEHFMGQQHVLVEDLEQEVITTRLMPVSTVFANLPRAVRELANTTNKEVSIELHGETTELDRKLLEALSDPLLHLVRNAVDHGIELPDEREAAGKPRQGHVVVSAEATGGEICITIQDDGRGMDAQRVRDTAVRKGLLAADAAALLNDQEALDLVFLPGFTTAPILTDISGRGVGMDVVRTNITELSGQVLLESQPGHGTTISLLLPLTLVTTRIMLVQVGQQTFALPAPGCQGIIWVSQRDISTVEGRATIGYNNRTVPVLRMADLLGIPAEQPFQRSERAPGLILGQAQRSLIVLVDRVLDEREAVIKPIGPLLEHQRRYVGAIQLGDGRLVLMLNPLTLTQNARGVAPLRAGDAEAPTRRSQRLLIADDSFTTRELIRSILQAAGYDVTAAMDGMDALDKLRQQPYDLVVSDVEMPRMNGFELTSNIRHELGLIDLPVIIVTSLASDEHKRRGLEAGAQAYIVKSQFNQDNLLEAIQQLLGSG